MINSRGFWDTNRLLPNLSQMTRPSESQEKKRFCQIVDFAIPADHRVKIKESKMRDKYQDLARELKTMEYEGDSDTIVIVVLGTIPEETGRLRNQRTSEDHLHYSIIEIGSF